MQRQVCWFIVIILTVLAGGLLWNVEPPFVAAMSTTRLFAGASTINLDLIPLQNIKRIATGAAHACAVTTSGGLQCWGTNDFGQLGDNTELMRNLPIAVFGLSSGVTAVVAGPHHTCALVEAGAVKCWGANESGQLGDGTQAAHKVPAEVQGLSSGVLALAAGSAHTCALTSGGGVKCWGANNFGQLGDGTTITRTTPVDVNGLASGVTAIAAGDDYTCASVNGAVLCWGHNGSGQLGDGTNTDRLMPTNVSGLSSGASVLAAGSAHTCAVINGGARCWGENSSGQLGNDNEISTNTPVNVFNLSSGVTALTAGEKYTCALINSGVKCWGANQFGQLGAGVSNYITQPTDVVGLPSGVAEVAAGGRYTCARMNSGGVKCWGLGVSGQLGDGVSYLSTTPVAVNGLSNGVGALALGGGHSCALVNGGAKCWGDNGYHQLGNPVFGASPAPVDVAITGSTLIGLAAGSDHTCTLTSSGALKCWGANYWGQLGGGNSQFADQIVDVTGLATGVITFTAGYNHTCAVVGVKAKCWGHNNYGQLGNGNTTDSPTPVDVMGLQSDNVVALAGGGYHTCALTQSGGVKCWGINREGELGQGSTTEYETTPLLVSGLASDVVGLSAGLYHTCALLKSGGVKCWGVNDFGQLGDKTTQDRHAPIDVFGLSSGVKALVTGYFYSCALLNSGAIQCWGDNSNGQLGDGAFGLANSRNAPVNVTGLPEAATIVAAGSGHTCARLSGGGVKCWGNSADGQLGNGQVAWRATPEDVLVPGTPTPTVTATLTPTSNPVTTGTPTPPATVIPGPGDAYEDDDACERAHLVTSDGVVQVHSFHDQADADWVKVNVVAGATYQIDVIVPATSAADVQLQLLDKCDGAATAHDAFGPGLRLRVKAQADGAYYLKLTNYDPAVAGAADTYQLFVRKLEDGPQPGALVVVGGRLRVNDELQANIYAATNRVYQLFLHHGYPADRIYYLANDLDQDPDKAPLTQDVDGLATHERLNYAITQWATDPKLGLGPERAFTLYLMDHGDYDKLFLNGRNETVGPDELDQWLTVLETARPGVKVNVIIDACLSGSFIDPTKSLSKPGRVVITSASNNSNAYPDREGSTVFTSAFIQALDGDTSLFGAYAAARQVGLAWPFAQTVWLDDNGNGVANEAGDGQLAQQRGFAFAGSFDQTWDAEPPYIAWIKGPPTITNRRGEISALVRTNSPNLDVWAVIYDPTYSPPPPSETLPLDQSRATIRLEDPDKDGVYRGIFAGFDQPGNYTIVVYAVDDAHLQSSPKQALFLVGSQSFLPMIRR